MRNEKQEIMKKLLMPYNGTSLQLKNHIVMAPMTRSRAIGNIPNALMAQYYGQRTGAGLIITEGTAPAPEALGYPRMPGIFSDKHIEGWKLVTAAVHQNDTKIFLQLMHTGRIGHIANLPEEVQLVGASAIPAAGQIHTDALGNQDHSMPDALTTERVKKVIASYVVAAENAIAAGFDGVEIHGANGYLIEQFLNPNVNDRTDQYGGSIENRTRFAVEVAEQVSAATLSAIRTEFEGTLIYSSNFTAETAEEELQKGDADLIAFGRSFLANPDFVERIIAGAPLNPVDFSTLYTPDAKGYVDYPTMTGASH